MREYYTGKVGVKQYQEKVEYYLYEYSGDLDYLKKSFQHIEYICV